MRLCLHETCFVIGLLASSLSRGGTCSVAGAWVQGFVEPSDALALL